jgi:energy-coupling factor transport system substrate-specific component
MERQRYYFSTRDLLIMAALAALGGVAGTYIKILSDLARSLVGVTGATQWAAGLHIIWLTLAVGLTGKQGAGTVTGILKGAVELLTGNPHGLIVVLVDIVAGLCVDLGFLPFRDKDRLPAYVLAGGLAAGSNVIVFQLFASLPADILSYGAILLLTLVAFASGALFGGVLSHGLLNALRRGGVVKDRAPAPFTGRRFYPLFLIAMVLLAVGMTLYLRQALRGPATVHVGGAVAAPYDYPEQHGDIEPATAEGTLRDVTASYTGVPLREIIARAQPEPGATQVLLQASDGYAFFISMDEVQENDGLLLTRQGQGDETAYNVVGAENSKAWVRGVSTITVVGAATLQVEGALASPGLYDPLEWQFEMDSVQLDVGDGPQKVQGAPLGDVLATMDPLSEANTVVLHTEGAPVTLPLAEVLEDDDVRIFSILTEDAAAFAVARIDGEVLAYPVTHIEVVGE